MGLSASHFHAKHFTGFALGEDLEWAAADFAVGREPLRGDAGIHDDLESLPAKGALNGLWDFKVMHKVFNRVI